MVSSSHLFRVPRGGRGQAPAAALVCLVALICNVAIALPEGAIARLGAGGVGAVQYSPDGKLLAVATTAGVELWDAHALERDAFLDANASMMCTAFSPDSATLAAGDSDGRVRLWDIASRREIGALEGHSYAVLSVAFSPDGATLAIGGSDGAVELWDAASRSQIATLTGHSGPVGVLTFLPDGATLATGASGNDNSVKLWDVASRRELATLQAHADAVAVFAISPDGATLASGSRDRTVTLWDIASRQEVATLHGHTQWVESVAFSPDGTTLASGSLRELKVWDVPSRSGIADLRGHTYWVWSLAFSPDGATLASSSGDNTVKLWDIATQQEAATVSRYSSLVSSVAFSPDGATLASGDGVDVKLWDVQSRQEAATLQGHTDWARSVAFSPDGETIASGSGDGTARLWDVASGAEVEVFHGHTASVLSVAFSPDGSPLATGSWDRAVRVWDTLSGQEIAALQGHTSGVTCVAFSPNGKTIAGGGRDGTAKLWDTTSHQATATLHSDSPHVESVAFSRSGTVVAVGGYAAVQRWKVSSSEPMPTLAAHLYTSYVSAIAVSPDGRLLAGAIGAAVALWDMDSGEHTVTLPGHAVETTSVAFSPDGQTLASGSWEGTILLWDMSAYSMRPSLAQRSAWVRDPGGNGDGVANPSERVRLRARMLNEGDGGASNAHATLTVGDADVRVVNGEVVHAFWPSGEARNNVGFVLDIAPDATPHDVTAIVDVTADNGGPWQFTYTFPIVAPAHEFTKRNAWIFDPKPWANRDGAANPGERVHPRVRLRNDGPSDATNVRVTVMTADPDVTVVGGEALHASWPAGAARNNDGLALDIASDATSRDVTLAIEVTSDEGGPWQFEFVFSIVVPPLEFTKRSAWVFDPSPDGNKDGVANPGERILPRVRLRNDGPGDATNVTVTLSTTDPDVTVTNGVVTHSTWPEGTARNSDGLALDVSPDATAHDVSMLVDVTADGAGPWQFAFIVPVVASAPRFAKRNAWIYEPTASTRNGMAEAGESVLPRVRLKNEGGADAENVSVTLTIDDPDVTIVSGTVTYATWPAGVARNNSGLALLISPTATPHDVQATVDVTADEGGPWQFTFTFAVTEPSVAFRKRNAWIYDPTPRGDHDGVAEAGERVFPRIRLMNDGSADAMNVRVTLTIDDPDVTVDRAEETHSTWPAGAARTIAGLMVRIARGAASHDVTAVVDVRASNGGPWQFAYTFPIVEEPPDFTLRNTWVFDPEPGGNRDGVASPGERVLPRLRLKTAAFTADAENVVVTLSTEDENATVVAGTVTHATWPDWTARNNNGLVVDLGEAAGASVAFVVDVTADNGGPWQFTYNMPVTAAAAPAALAAPRPDVSALLPNYPNPFNPDTWIPFDLAEASDVTVRVYDARGREARRLRLGHLDAGVYRGRSSAAYWDGRNELGESVASGVYIYELRAGEFVERRRMVIRK
ncbi:hypothetical protein CMK11_09050 [Candidatus Poribacteria bacterium]|nr:hypothetical protein [Candidatus Poribacteria bacterium]